MEDRESPQAQLPKKSCQAQLPDLPPDPLPAPLPEPQTTHARLPDEPVCQWTPKFDPISKLKKPSLGFQDLLSTQNRRPEYLACDLSFRVESIVPAGREGSVGEKPPELLQFSLKTFDRNINIKLA